MAGVQTLCELFPHVPEKLVRKLFKEHKSDVERTHEAIALIAHDWEPRPSPPVEEWEQPPPHEEPPQSALQPADDVRKKLSAMFPHGDVTRALDTSGGDFDLAVDVLLADSDDLSRSISDIAEAFQLPRGEVEADFRAHNNEVEAVANAILRRSLSASAGTAADAVAAAPGNPLAVAAMSHAVAASEPQPPAANSLAFLQNMLFLQKMFPEESHEILVGLMEEHDNNLVDVVDFMLSLDLLKVHVAELEQSEVDADAPPELQQLCEVFPDHEREQLVAVLEASNWNVEEATQVLLGGGGVDSPSGTPQQQRWTKLNVRDVFGKVVVGQTPKWNGANTSIVGNRDAVRPPLRVSPSQSQTPPPPTSSSIYAAYEANSRSSVAAQDRNAPAPAVVVPPSSHRDALEMSRVHLVERKKWMQLAVKSYETGNEHAARTFTALAQREERFQNLWTNRVANKMHVVDLHGYTVAQALDISLQTLHAMLEGETVRLITGRGKHSVGGIGRIKLALEERMQTPAMVEQYHTTVGLGFLTVTKRK